MIMEEIGIAPSVTLDDNRNNFFLLMWKKLPDQRFGILSGSPFPEYHINNAT